MDGWYVCSREQKSTTARSWPAARWGRWRNENRSYSILHYFWFHGTQRGVAWRPVCVNVIYHILGVLANSCSNYRAPVVAVVLGHCTHRIHAGIREWIDYGTHIGWGASGDGSIGKRWNVFACAGVRADVCAECAWSSIYLCAAAMRKLCAWDVRFVCVHCISPCSLICNIIFVNAIWERRWWCYWLTWNSCILIQLYNTRIIITFFIMKQFKSKRCTFVDKTCT